MGKKNRKVRLGTPEANELLARERKEAEAREESRDHIAAMKAALEQVSAEELPPSVEEVRARAAEEAERRRAVTAFYAEKILPELRKLGEELRETRRVLRRAGLSDAQIARDPAVRSRESILNGLLGSLPEALRKTAEFRLETDALIESIDFQLSRLKEGWKGNPWEDFREAARRAIELGLLRPATEKENEAIASGSFRGVFLGLGTRENPENYLPAEGVLAQAVMGKLYRLRGAAAKASLHFREEMEEIEKSRNQRVARLGTTAADVATLLEGGEVHVAGFFPWRRRDGREVRAFLEARSRGDGVIEILDSSEFRTIKTVDPDLNPTQFGIVRAALERLKKALEKGSNE
jgi:hypothetical protein